MNDLEADFKAGNVRALARSISLVERRDPAGLQLAERLTAEAKPTPVVGVTGAPGTGKSTLVDAALTRLRHVGERVAVIAADPNSPHSGGAILGDRVRMQRHALDPGVYIRSMGCRGHLGGLPVAAAQVVRLVAAFGFDTIFLETVGVGQAELDVASIADTTLLVLAPGAGDEVQMIKAGIMEVADILVVNKVDLAGADITLRQARSALNLGAKAAWKPPIVATVASRQEGLEEMLAAIKRHRQYLGESGQMEIRSQARFIQETLSLIEERARQEARSLLSSDVPLGRRLLSGGLPHQAAEELWARIASCRSPASEGGGQE